MPTLIERPTRITAAGNMPKLIDEYVGRVNTPANTSAGVAAAEGPMVSIAHMRSPAGWVEPGQTPEFEEYTLVLRGRLHVQHAGGTLEVAAGQAIVAHPGEWIQYSTPDEATEYIAICLPAFSLDTVHRDPEK
ncbi:MAG TPA: cupin [Candidatus Sulfotelmatobacter sp.]|nr:cupin [Candidatus Sulfotelmatobacter sp.]